jgi:hypothetical protein
VEGTPGAAERVPFREGTGEAALVGTELPWPLRTSVSSFERGRNRTVVLLGVVPVTSGHELATGGVRVNQVGVNPLRRAVVVVGVGRAYRPKRPLT